MQCSIGRRLRRLRLVEGDITEGGEGGILQRRRESWDRTRTWVRTWVVGIKEENEAGPVFLLLLLGHKHKTWKSGHACGKKGDGMGWVTIITIFSKRDEREEQKRDTGGFSLTSDCCPCEHTTPFSSSSPSSLPRKKVLMRR